MFVQSENDNSSFRHLLKTGDVGKFVIVTEEAIAKGIRRIVAVTGPEADRAVERAGRLADSILKLKEEIEAEETKKDRTVQKSLVKELVILSDVNTFRCTLL